MSVVDANCVSRVKADPDKHTTECALKCVKGGYGLIDADGNYLKFDAAGNEKAVAALKATKKTDHLRATVVGDKDGATIKVTESVSIAVTGGARGYFRSGATAARSSSRLPMMVRPQRAGRAPACSQVSPGG